MTLNTEKYEEVFNMLKKYLTDTQLNTNPYSPKVTKLHKEVIDQSEFPLIVFEEIENTTNTKTYGGNESISNITYEVNIYTINQVISNKEIANMQIARELARLVDYVLGEGYKMNRTFMSPTPNLDRNVYRITLRYEKLLYDNRSKFIN